ncbi:hypothetical protein [Aestuariimicrobium sp. Y1814]|uniref:hypothetical protein n=1 Tax=Aestuariimicrobium sp. Y1814 TaxID=3418742 RepID=UPI003DA75AD8
MTHQPQHPYYPAANQPHPAAAWQGQEPAPPRKKRRASTVIGVLVVVAVVAVGLGVGAITRGPEQAIETFFALLNEPSPSTRDFQQVTTGVGIGGILEARASSEPGGYSVVSIGEHSHGFVRVTWSHQGDEFTNDIPVTKEGSSWKLVKPFPTVAFLSPDHLRFQANGKSTLVNSQRLYYPGHYTITPLANTNYDPVFWVPRKPTFDLAPAEVRQITIEGHLTDEAAASTRQSVIDAFAECLSDDNFTGYIRCPFMPRRPDNAIARPEVVWSSDPADAGRQPKLVDNPSVQAPCYEITGTLVHTYTTVDNTRATGREPLATKGCVFQGTVTWR